MSRPFERTRTGTIDCDCSPPRPHGVEHVYNYHGCGCDPCRAAAVEGVAMRRRRPRTVPADWSRDLIALHLSRGARLDRLAADLGVHVTTLRNVRRGDTKHVRRATEEALLNHPLPPPRKRTP